MLALVADYAGGWALRDLEKIDAGLSPAGIAPFLKALVNQFQSSARDRFATEGADVGGWEELKESTLRIREELGFPPGPINERTGRLKQYVVENQGEVLYDGIGTQLQWPSPAPGGGTDLAYSYGTAQAGSNHWRTPARPVVALTFDDVVAINLAFGRFVGGIL